MTAQIIPFPLHRAKSMTDKALDRLLRDIKQLPPLVKQHGDKTPPEAA